MSNSLRRHGHVAYQDPQSMGFSRQEYWSGLKDRAKSLHVPWSEFINPSHTQKRKRSAGPSCRDPIFILWILCELLRLETDSWGLNSILCPAQFLPCGLPDPGLFQTLFCFSVKSPDWKGCYSGAFFFFFFGIQGPFSVLFSYKVTETKAQF